MRALLLLLLVAVLGAPSLAAACSCMSLGGTTERFEQADVVVHGLVIRERVPLLSSVPTPRLPRWTPRFIRNLTYGGVTADVEVIQAWKATPAGVISVNLGSGQCCDCTLGAGGLPVGEEVVLFGRIRDGKQYIGASSCSPPLRGQRVRDALEEFGPGITDLPAGPWLWRAARWVGRLGVLLALLWAGRLWTRRRSRAA